MSGHQAIIIFSGDGRTPRFGPDIMRPGGTAETLTTRRNVQANNAERDP